MRVQKTRYSSTVLNTCINPPDNVSKVMCKSLCHGDADSTVNINFQPLYAPQIVLVHTFFKNTPSKGSGDFGSSVATMPSKREFFCPV
jgi:hypothetical protein